MADPSPHTTGPARAGAPGAAAEFVDECTIHVRGGRGGNGAVSFRREAHVPRGGPDGGDGGRGGDVVLEADEGLTSLLDLHRHPHQRGGDGRHGAGALKTGATGQDTVLPVPIGTTVCRRDSGVQVADMVRDGQRVTVAAGGRGGRGNATFASRHRRIPRFAERGEQVTEVSLRLELKVIADVGLVGFPSTGKSSLISRLSAARPRIEAWPFTTLTPHLGVMRAGDTADGSPIDVVLADVPGLVEGAAEGRGLGHRFLRHVERCRVLVHVLDTTPFDQDRDPVSDLAVVRHELARHDATLLDRVQVVVLNKVDVPDGQAMADLVHDQLAGDGYEVFDVSAVSGAGLDVLRYRLGELVHAQREGDRDRDAATRQPEEHVLLRLAPGGPDFEVGRDETGMVQVTGDRVERWVQMLPLDNPQAAAYLQGRLRRAGVEKALIEAGVRAGDDVLIGDVVFAFDPAIEDLPEDERAAVLADTDSGEQE